MSANVDILFYVQHLLGIGHLTRAATLVRAIRRAGLSVTLVSGGESVPGLDVADAGFVQLPSIRTDGIEFRELLDENDRPVTEQFKTQRTNKLLELFDQTKPRILMIEMFPFGRRQMRFELLPLLEAARKRRPRPVIVSSVRDILVEAPKSSRFQDMVKMSRTLFDQVLVHGHPHVIPFDRTFPLAPAIEDQIVHTGYVVDERVNTGETPTSQVKEVIVSTGGGRVCEPLLEVVCSMRKQSALADQPWRMLIGTNLNEDRFRYWQHQANGGLTVERARADFVRLLGQCQLSISQAGYNTVMEVMRAGCPRIVVPYTGGLETEQTVRSRLLAERGLVILIEPQELCDKKMLNAIAQSQSTMPEIFPASYTSGALNAANHLKKIQEIES